MKALLEELKALDLGTYLDIMGKIGIFQFDDPRREHIILGEVMRAIQAKGWRFGVGNLNGYIEAHVFYSPINCGVSEQECASPAAALLTAYIAALKGGE